MTIDTAEHERVARWQDDLLPHIVDRLGEQRPDGVSSVWATPSGLRTITYRQLANAVNGLAAWLVSHLGPGHHGRGDADPEVLTYIGANDVRYVVALLAAVKAGYTVCDIVVPREREVMPSCSWFGWVAYAKRPPRPVSSFLPRPGTVSRRTSPSSTN
jgi:acyl-CoA synthetase (AMP-forming)/AMP-acid ligase II